MELLLIRHGRPHPQRVEQPGVSADPALTDEGRAQAALLGRWFADGHGPRPDLVYASPMRRALDTAAEIISRTEAPLRIDDRLREFDWGASEYELAEDTLADPARSRELWRALETGVWGAHRFDPDVFESTVAAAFADIVAAHPSTVVAVVCHGGVINSFLGAVLQRPRGMFFQPDYTSVSRVVASRGGRRQVLTLNDTGHLHLARITTGGPS